MGKENRLSETTWFPHDTDTITDLKIAALLEDFGAEGYGIYWHIIELLHAEKNGKLPLGTLVPKAVARGMNVPVDRVSPVTNACLNEYGLFVADGEFFTAERVQRNILARQESTKKRQEAGQKGGRAKAANAKQGYSNAKAEVKQRYSNGVAKPSTVQYSTVHPSLEGVSVRDNVPVSNQGGNAPALDPLKGSGPTLPPEVPEVPIEVLEATVKILNKVEEKMTTEQRENFGQRIEKNFSLQGIKTLGLVINRDFKLAEKKFKASDLEKLISRRES